MSPPSNAGLTPEIDALRQEFERIAQQADQLVAPLSDAQFSWQPSPERWSLAHCLDHLNATARVYLPALDEAIANASKRAMFGRGPYSYNVIGRLMVALMEPPPRFTFKAPKEFLPPIERPRREIVAAFRAYQVQYVDRLRQANGVDLARARVRSPASRWLALPLGSGFELMAAHERRHLHQVERLMATPGFPG